MDSNSYNTGGFPASNAQNYTAVHGQESDGQTQFADPIPFHTNEWSTGLCGCCSVHDHCCNSCGFCFAALMFPCCAQGALLKDTGLVDDVYGASCVFCCCYTIPLVPFAVFCNLRQSIASARGINETCFSTFCQVLCCFPCAMTQVYNDLVIGNYKFQKNPSMYDSYIGKISNTATLVANVSVTPLLPPNGMTVVSGM